MPNIKRKINRGQPITRDDIPANCNNQYAIYSTYLIRHDGPPESYTAPAELLALKQILGTVADDFVTSAGLRELGISTGTMRRVAIHLAKNSAQN